MSDATVRAGRNGGPAAGGEIGGMSGFSGYMDVTTLEVCTLPVRHVPAYHCAWALEQAIRQRVESASITRFADVDTIKRRPSPRAMVWRDIVHAALLDMAHAAFLFQSHFFFDWFLYGHGSPDRAHAKPSHHRFSRATFPSAPSLIHDGLSAVGPEYFRSETPQDITHTSFSTTEFVK